MNKSNLLILSLGVLILVFFSFLFLQVRKNEIQQSNVRQNLTSEETTFIEPKSNSLQAYLNEIPVVESGCIPDGWADDTLAKTSCCSGSAIKGSTYCVNKEDWFTTWESCYQICGQTSETNLCPFGPVGTPWCPCPKGTKSDGTYRQGSCIPE